jgi:hypothetical protein
MSVYCSLRAHGERAYQNLDLGSHHREVQMTYEEIVSLLGYAGGHEQAVRIMTTAQTEVIGIPMSVDTHVTAHEVYLRPTGSDDTEIAVSLAAIEKVELV